MVKDNNYFYLTVTLNILMSDSEIIDLVLQGDRNRYRLLVEKYQQMIFQTAMGFLHNKDDADDLTQEVFVQAYQSLNRFKGKAAFSTWLYRITVNAALNKIKRSSRNPIKNRIDSIFSRDMTIEIPFMQSDQENPESILIRREHSEWLQKILDSLPEKQRIAIVLSKYDDLSQKEIADIMDTTEGAVEALLQRAKINLRRKLTVSARKKPKTA